jgi:ABC-2 type transport system ATP-binding protein
MNGMIEVKGLVKDFGSKRAINNLSFSVRPGEIFGLLGPNGAGKTTTIRILNGLLPVSGGEVRIFGSDPIAAGESVRARVGVLTETPALYERLSARENLRFSGRLSGISETELDSRIDDILTTFELKDRIDDKVGGFSKGMKQRMALARALLHRPELLFLDEPTSSLDPESALQVNELIDRISHEDGRTVFLCTHNLVEAQRLCDRMAVINHGELLALGTMDELSKSLFPGVWVEIEFIQSPPDSLSEILSNNSGILQSRLDGAVLHVQVTGRDVVAELLSRLISSGARVARVTPREVSLEEVYFTLQNHQNGVS